jgi:hypothetical protein
MLRLIGGENLCENLCEFAQTLGCLASGNGLMLSKRGFDEIAVGNYRTG